MNICNKLPLLFVTKREGPAAEAAGPFFLPQGGEGKLLYDNAAGVSNQGPRVKCYTIHKVYVISCICQSQ